MTGNNRYREQPLQHEDDHTYYLRHSLKLSPQDEYPEEEEQIIILQSAMNKPVQVGDRVQIEETDGIYYIEILKEETEQKKAEIQSLMDRLRRKNQ
ncbi:hypothetical protein ACQKNB_14250 [Lysinibacillus xylanilyticus]|uniref:hypothetical protein n=1 Tax=Lysinibacillus xylanilyticus TaxID=582475 RepID=UPI003D015A86